MDKGKEIIKEAKEILRKREYYENKYKTIIS